MKYIKDESLFLALKESFIERYVAQLGQAVMVSVS